MIKKVAIPPPPKKKKPMETKIILETHQQKF